MPYDTIIVGAGSAGVVLAARLAGAGESVLLLEAGHWATGNQSVNHPSSWFFLQGSELDWNYATEAAHNVDARVFAWPRGRAVGGSSVINAMTWLRGNRRDFDSWAGLGATGWGYGDLLPYFRLSENWRGKPSEFHGESGGVTVTPDANPSRAARAFVKAAEHAGIPFNADFNGEDSFGAGFFPHSIKDSVRESTATAYFPDEQLPENLRLVTGARVLRLLFEGNCCVGVLYLDDDGHEQEARSAQVIVSAGAVESPKLLLQSGIGPRHHLGELGIDVIADLPVGENLQDHVAACVAMRSEADLEIDAASALGEAGLFAHSKPGIEDEPPDLQFTVAPVVLTGVGPEPGAVPPNGFTLMPTVARPRSRGSVRLRSSDPLAAPVIATNYLAHEEDREVLRRGVRLAFEILGHEPLRSLGSEMLQPTAPPASEEEVDALINASLMTFYHPSGTCRMAVDGVVDSDLRVRGVAGLSVVDASVIPLIPSANINAAVIAIAEKAAAERTGTTSLPT